MREGRSARKTGWAQPAAANSGPLGLQLIDASERWYAHLTFILLLSWLAIAVPASALHSVWAASTGAVITLGALAIWRYSWAALNFVRSLIYRQLAFIPLRKRADAAALASQIAGHPPRAFLLITSFRQDGDTAARVYRAAFKAALNARGKATVVASLVDIADQRLVTSLYRLMCGATSKVDLVIVRIAGTGKRDALAQGFRAISQRLPADDDLVAVIDGDSIVPLDLLEKCSGFFLADPRVGALTTDENSEVRGGPLFHVWYSLRFAQRNIFMASNGLSRRVLTLTGRMSMFRASVACSPDFIRQIEHDSIAHWRLGRIDFLTGDDKSSWYWLLKSGYHMLYVPDVMVSTVEDPPGKHFIPAAAELMTRWFGNMLRTNARALALGPHRVGLFTWIAILDQRISMWTSLAGLIMVLLVGIFVTPTAFYAYAVWTLFTRYIITLSLLTSRRRVSVLYPFFIYFNQVFGSAIKVYVFFRPDKQRWTRQKTTLRGASGALATIRALSSNYMTALSITAFVASLAVLTGLLPVPSVATLRHLLIWG